MVGLEQLLTTSGPNSKVVWAARSGLEPHLAYQHPRREGGSQGTYSNPDECRHQKSPLKKDQSSVGVQRTL